MVEEGLKLAALHENIVVKVPMIKEGIKAIKYFSDNEIKTNCTLVFSAGQAILAAKAGATMVSPFIGRIDDGSWDGVQLIEQIVNIYNAQGFTTEVLAASIRSPLHIVRCAEVGADICTCPLSSILGLLNHPLTDIGLAKFLKTLKASQVRAPANNIVFPTLFHLNLRIPLVAGYAFFYSEQDKPWFVAPKTLYGKA